MTENNGDITVNAGIVSIPEKRIFAVIRSVQCKLAGTQKIETKINDVKSSITGIQQHIEAMSEIVNILVADISGGWSSEKRERVQKVMWNFGIVNIGLKTVIAKGNPFTQQELDTLKGYTQQAQMGQTFTPEQATKFRDLSERASLEYPDQQWVGELLKISLFVFAVYCIAQLLKSDK